MSCSQPSCYTDVLCVSVSSHTETFPPYKAHAQLTRLGELLELTRFSRLFPKDKEETVSKETRLIDKLYGEPSLERQLQASSPTLRPGILSAVSAFKSVLVQQETLTNSPLSKTDLAFTKLHLSAIFSLLYYCSLINNK